MNETISARKTLEQNRAAHALDKIEKVKTSQKEYGSRARSLPAMIQTNGLGQTLAFLAAKGENDANKAETQLYNHLTGWLNLRIAKTKTEDAQDFLAWLVKQNSEVYRRATTEALAYSMWLRRFAEAKGWADQDQKG